MVVSGFNLTWECLRHVVLTHPFLLHSQSGKLQHHLILFIIYYVFITNIIIRIVLQAEIVELWPVK